MMAKLNIKDVLPMVLAYVALPNNRVGGNLHIVLDDQNIKDYHIQFCIDMAIEKGDTAGVELGRAILQLSKTQRLKLAYLWY
jgi:hypothetical protein